MKSMNREMISDELYIEPATENVILAEKIASALITDFFDKAATEMRDGGSIEDALYGKTVMAAGRLSDMITKLRDEAKGDERERFAPIIREMANVMVGLQWMGYDFDKVDGDKE